ncbi:helix-turn-helix domain-containing protein, partial [Actinokineospora enzanensis]
MACRVVLGVEERETISRELRAGRSLRCIGRLLGRHHSVIAREVARNGGREGYRAASAVRRARRTCRRPK